MNGVTLVVIAAFSENRRVIGKSGGIPWDIPEDRARFWALTRGHAVIMGRKTYESIGHPLDGRLTVLVSATKTVGGTQCVTVSSLDAAIAAARTRGYSTVFIAGGQRLYEEAVNDADILYLTEIHENYDGDVFFPCFDETKYEKTVEKAAEQFSFLTYRKILRPMAEK